MRAGCGHAGTIVAPRPRLLVHDRGVEREIVDAKSELRLRVRRGRSSRIGSGAVPRGGAAAHALLDAARAAGLLDPQGRPGVVGPTVVAAYLAMPGEPDPGLLCAAVRAQGGSVLLPVPEPRRGLRWAMDDGTRGTAAAPVRVPVPTGPVIGTGAVALLDHGVRVLFIPALSVDGSGRRLGQGGGYYDRLLTDLAAARRSGVATPRVVAVVHDDELLEGDRIPIEEHDEPVDAALTPSGLWSLG